MSRCFSFPPPGYLRNSTDTLIEESIKIRLDMEKPNKDRKEKKDKKDRNETKEERRLRKEKKRERKEKRKREKEETPKDSTSAGSLKFKVVNEVKETENKGKLLKGEYYENEHIEKSDITEELGKPVSSPQEPYSSDSSQSSKRKRDTLLSSKDNGIGIRIRLPLRKHSEPEEIKQGVHLGSSSRSVGNSDSVTQETRRVQRPLQRITKVEYPNQLPGNSASEVCRPSLKKVETQNQLCRPSLKKVETHSASQVCRPPLKKVETHSASQVCRSPVKKVETRFPGNSVSQVCNPPVKKVETRFPGNSASQVCRAPLKKVESRLPRNSSSNVCIPPLKKVESLNQLSGNSVSKDCRPPLKKDETLCQLPGNSTSTIPFKKVETSNQMRGNSASKLCRSLKNSAPLDSVDEESLRMESLYNSLLSNIPPIKYDCFDSVDQDWLFSSEQTEAKPVSKKQKIDNALQCSKSLWPPRAQYMSDVEMYALPYTVPF